MNLRDYRLSRYPGVCLDVVSAGHTTYVVAYCCVDPSACRCDYEQAWRLCCDCMLLHQAASYRYLGFVGILAVCVPSQISNLVSLIDEGEGGIDLKFFFINWRFYSDISISLLISAKKIMGRLVSEAGPP